jgi:hypothetical protein
MLQPAALLQRHGLMASFGRTLKSLTVSFTLMVLSMGVSFAERMT